MAGGAGVACGGRGREHDVSERLARALVTDVVLADALCQGRRLDAAAGLVVDERKAPSVIKQAAHREAHRLVGVLEQRRRAAVP